VCIERCMHGSAGVVTRNYGCTCYDWPYNQDITQCATTGTLPRRKRRENQQAKGADRLEPKGQWPRAGVSPFPGRRCRATGEQAEPTPSVIRPWNVVSPSSSLRGRPAVRWSPMGRRVGDEGRSERCPVIGRIGVEPPGEITPRESGPTSLRSFVTRAPGEPLQEASR
jgi:hypothetical protein